MHYLLFFWSAVKWLWHRLRSRKDTRHPLNLIEGITIRDEILLFHLEISDASQLAGAVRLLTTRAGKTPFPLATVADWIDQAILICVVDPLIGIPAADSLNQMTSWLRALRAVGIRTAADLQDNAGDVERLTAALRHIDGILTQPDSAAAGHQGIFDEMNTPQRLQQLPKYLAPWQDTLRRIARVLDQPSAS